MKSAAKRAVGYRWYRCPSCGARYQALPEHRGCECGYHQVQRESKYRLREARRLEAMQEFMREVRESVIRADRAYEAELLGV